MPVVAIRRCDCVVDAARLVLYSRSRVRRGVVQRLHSNRRVRGISEGRNVHGLPRALLQETRSSSSGVRVVGKGQPCPLSNVTVRRMLLFRLVAAASATGGGKNHEGTLRRPRTHHAWVPTLSSGSLAGSYTKGSSFTPRLLPPLSVALAAAGAAVATSIVEAAAAATVDDSAVAASCGCVGRGCCCG